MSVDVDVDVDVDEDVDVDVSGDCVCKLTEVTGQNRRAGKASPGWNQFEPCDMGEGEGE